MDHPVLDHEGPWTEDAYLTLVHPPGRGRVELMDGALIVGPGPTPQRDRVLAAVRDVVEQALPDGLRVLGPVPLRLGPDCVLVPDLLVTRTRATADPEVFDAADTLMVVEAVGREHGAAYRVFKPQLYARSGIPYSLLLDHDTPFAVADMIINGRYHEYGRAIDDATLIVEEPFRLDIDLGAVCGGTVDAPAAH